MYGFISVIFYFYCVLFRVSTEFSVQTSDFDFSLYLSGPGTPDVYYFSFVYSPVIFSCELMKLSVQTRKP